MNDDDSNTQEQLRSLLRSADESRIRSRYTANPASSTGSFEGRRFGSSSATNPNDYTLSEKKVNELADLIGTIEGSTYSTDKLRSSRSFPSSSLNSRSATGLPATYRPGGRSSEITPPSLERNMPLRTSASYDKGDRDSVRRSIDLEDEESVRESQGRGMTNDRSQPTARSYQPPPARDSDNQSYSYSRSATTVTSSTNGDGAAGGGKEQDQSDFTVIRFQQNYVIRGKHGKYLTALPEELGPSPQLSSSLPEQSPNAKAFEMSRSPVPPSRTYLLGAEGQGIGELMDCLTFVPVDNKEPQHSEVKYGSVVAIKSSYSKERLLGLRDGTKLGFWRHVVGQGEKWVILKANQSVTHSVVNSNTSLSGIIPSHQLNLEDVSARGKYVRVGDTILIQCYKSDHCLSLVEVATTFASSYVSGNPNTVASGPGYEIRLQLKDRSGLGSEVWQIEVFGTVPLPTWCQSRPFLSGKYLVMPASLRAPPPEVESRVFPRASNMSTFMQNIHSNLHPLHDYEVEEQQHILMREILLLLSGIEGNYIRIAAAVKSFSQDQANKDFDDAAVEEEMRKYRDGGGGLKDFHNALNQRMTAPPSITLPSIDSIKLVIDVDSADRSLATQVTQLLTMCEQSLKIRHFLRQQSRYEYGYVSHAFCASIKSILHDFDVIICQLEYLLNAEKLSIQKFIFLLQQSKTTLQLLDKMIASVKELNGGQLLNELYSQYQQQGDSNAKQLYEYLLEKAFEPFINILSIWIFRGELEDPYHEFMIQEDITVTKEALQEDFNAQYWDNRYTLQSSHIPTIFQPYSQKILNTGKYLNVIRDCIGDYAFLTESSSSSSSSSHNTSSVVVAGKRENSSFFYRNKENQSPHVPHHPMEKFLQFSQQYSSQHRHKKGSGRMTSETSSGAVFSIMNAQSCRSLFEAVEVAYQYSSQSLLQLLLNGYSLRSHFESLGKFFLLQHGDFFIQFMDIAEQDLRKEVKDITIVRLNHLLQLAIQTSTLASDDHKDLISCTLASHNLIQHLHLIQTAGETATVSTMSDAIYASLSTQGLKGIEAFTLDYHVTWPLSILLSRRILTKYQLLSRLLYFSKHVERRLLTSWISLQVCKEIPLLRELLMESYTLRHRMLHFIQNFVYYITFEVIHPRNHEFEEEFAVALGSKDINEIMELHERFLDNCLKECLLASSDLLKILTKIMTTCLLFADHLVKLFNEIDEHYQKKEEFYLSQLKASAQQPASGRSPSVSKSQSNDQTANKTGGKEGGVKGRDRLQKAVVQRQWKIVNYSELLFQEIKHDSFHRILHKFINTFDQQLKEFLETLWTDSNRHHMQLSNLCVRLDYNGFYSSIFVEKDNTMFSTSNNNNTTGQGKPQT